MEFDDKKRIKVDEHFRTNVEGIYAIGDVIAGPMLAHKAEDEGIACVEIIAGKAGHVNYEAIAGIIYTNPELAGVGLTEDQAKEKGIDVRIGKFPFRANGRALCSDDVEGMVKFVADAKTDRILGAHILHHAASELIAEAVSVIEFGGSSEDIGRTCHSHPTLSEAVREAALKCGETRTAHHKPLIAVIAWRKPGGSLRNYLEFAASRRRMTSSVTSADAAQIIAPNASANDVPTQCAAAPASRLPSGIMAPKTSDHTPMTRPRISSGTIVCSTVFDVEKNRSIPNPATKRNARELEKFRLNERANSAIENIQTPPSASLRGGNRCP